MSFVDIPGYTEVGPISYEEYLYGSDRKHTKEMLKDFLKGGIFSIGFTKSNGDARYMTCTRNAKVLGYLIGNTEWEKNDSKHENSLSIPVFDLDLEEWRSFNVDRIFSMELIARIKND